MNRITDFNIMNTVTSNPVITNTSNFINEPSLEKLPVRKRSSSITNDDTGSDFDIVPSS